ncbi:MAG: ferritin family protein [Bacteriovoracaceae bacterium]|nr:ferritin family protein [Bacteriovoracaceae bacterium]
MLQQVAGDLFHIKNHFNNLKGDKKTIDIVNEMEFDDIMEMAIIEEEEAYHLYLDLAAHVEDKVASDILYQLAKEENDHINLLEKYYGGDPSDFIVPKTEDFEHFDNLTPNDILSDTSVSNLILYAMKKEQESYQFYIAIAKLCKNVEARDTFIKLARLELAHKNKLEMIWFRRDSIFPGEQKLNRPKRNSHK